MVRPLLPKDVDRLEPSLGHQDLGHSVASIYQSREVPSINRCCGLVVAVPDVVYDVCARTQRACI